MLAHVFILKMFSSAFVWPFPQRGGQIPSLGKLDAKMQILLHLKRFTKSRVCIRDTDSPSRDLEGMNKTAKNGTDTRKKGTRPWKKENKMQTKSTRHDQDSNGAITSRAKITFVQFLSGRDFGEFENRAASLVFHEHLQAIPRRKGLRVQNSAI